MKSERTFGENKEEVSPELAAMIESVKNNPKMEGWTSQDIREYAIAQLNFRKKDKKKIPEDDDPLMR